MNIYAVSIMAHRRESDIMIARGMALAFKENSEHDVIRKAMRRAKAEWPLEDDWYGHKVGVCVVPQEWLEKVNA